MKIKKFIFLFILPLCLIFIGFAIFQENNDFFIGFAQVFGGCIAGSLTVYGVHKTILNQEDARKSDVKNSENRQEGYLRKAEERQREDFRVKLLPLIVYEIIETDIGDYSFDPEVVIVKKDFTQQSQHLNDDDNYEIKTVTLLCKISNIGLNLAQNISIDIINSHDYNSALLQTPRINNTNFYLRHDETGDNFVINCQYLNKENRQFTFKIVTFYDDIIGTRYLSESSVNISQDSQGNLITSVDNNLQYMKVEDPFIYSQHKNFNDLHRNRSRAANIYRYFNIFNEIINKYHMKLDKSGMKELEEKYEFTSGDGAPYTYKVVENNRIYEIIEEGIQTSISKGLIRYQIISLVDVIKKDVIDYQVRIIENTLPISDEELLKYLK